jgi:SAM-dependent methyltransferase
MKKTPWASFTEEKIKKIFTEKKHIIDIGGGLRIIKEKNNRYEPNNEWIRPYLKNVDYKILDPVDTFHPDIVGDIHNLPFESNSIEAFFCIAVLEHVENPILASQEMYRTLEKNGYCFVYVPFLYYYHAEKGYYGDFWRFTPDSIRYMFRDFEYIEIMPVRGAIETLCRLTPFGRYSFFNKLAYFLDYITKKSNSKQVSGYYVFLQK